MFIRQFREPQLELGGAARDAGHRAQGAGQARTEGPRSNWMGHRPCLPDSLPVIGESERHRGLWLAFGHTPRLDLRPFSVARFSAPAAAAR
jgi:glycine/D-amino acid oxidase-like deaminating enzyme